MMNCLYVCALLMCINYKICDYFIKIFYSGCGQLFIRHCNLKL